MYLNKLVFILIFFSNSVFADGENLSSPRKTFTTNIPVILEALDLMGSSPVCVQSEENPQVELIAILKEIKAQQPAKLKLASMAVFANDYGKSTACLIIEKETNSVGL